MSNVLTLPDKKGMPPKITVRTLYEELNRLRRENRQLRLEREILSKAAAWFARETNAIPPKGSGS